MRSRGILRTARWGGTYALHPSAASAPCCDVDDAAHKAGSIVHDLESHAWTGTGIGWQTDSIIRDRQSDVVVVRFSFLIFLIFIVFFLTIIITILIPVYLLSLGLVPRFQPLLGNPVMLIA